MIDIRPALKHGGFSSHCRNDQCPECESKATSLVIRAVDRREVWGRAQVVECDDCSHRWSV